MARALWMTTLEVALVALAFLSLHIPLETEPVVLADLPTFFLIVVPQCTTFDQWQRGDPGSFTDCRCLSGVTLRP
jgi:hypothetical protein